MLNNPIEDQLRKRLSQHLTPIDVDALWDRVEPRLLNNVEQRRMLPFWVWFVAGLILYASLLRLSDVRDGSSQPLVVLTDPQLPTETNAPAPVANSTILVPTSPVATTQGNVVNDPALKQEPATKAPYTTLPAQPKAPISATEQEKPRTYAKTKITDPEEKSSRSALISEEVSTVLEDISQPKTDAGFTAPLGTTARINNQVEQDLRSVEMNARRDEVMTDQLNKQSLQQLVRANEILEVKGPSIEAHSDQEIERLRAKPNKMKKVIDSKSPFWTVEPGIALSLASSSRSGVEELGNEAALEGISLQGLVGYHRPSGFSIRTGLVASRINSQLDAEIDRPGTQTQEVVDFLIENTNGIVNAQLTTLELATIETTTSKFYNSVSSIDLPLLIGYRLSRNKWGLQVEAGPTFNLSSGGEAHRYNGTGFAAVGDNYFRKKLKGQGFLASFGGTYRLTNKTSLNASLRYQSFGNGGFENPEVPSYSTNYRLSGIQLGYRVRF